MHLYTRNHISNILKIADYSDHKSFKQLFKLNDSWCKKFDHAHFDVIMTSSKVQKIFFYFFKTLVVLKRFLAQKQGNKIKMVATFMKDNRLSFQKIYRKSQISFSFAEKIAFEFDCFFDKIFFKVTITLNRYLRRPKHQRPNGAQNVEKIVQIKVCRSFKTKSKKM